MFLISNRQYDEVIEMLTAYVQTDGSACNLREQNRYRRARLLIKALSKRKPIDNETINIINNPKNK